MNIDTTITWKSFSLYFCVATCYVHMHGSAFTRAGYEISDGGETTSDTKSIKQLEGHLSRAKANDFFKRESRRRNSIRKALYII